MAEWEGQWGREGGSEDEWGGGAHIGSHDSMTSQMCRWHLTIAKLFWPTHLQVFAKTGNNKKNPIRTRAKILKEKKINTFSIVGTLPIFLDCVLHEQYTRPAVSRALQVCFFNAIRYILRRRWIVVPCGQLALDSLSAHTSWPAYSSPRWEPRCSQAHRWGAPWWPEHPYLEVK